MDIAVVQEKNLLEEASDVSKVRTLDSSGNSRWTKNADVKKSMNLDKVDNTADVDKPISTSVQEELTSLNEICNDKVDKLTGYIYLGVATTGTTPATYGTKDRVYYEIDLPVGSTTLSNFGLSAIVLTETTRYQIRWNGSAWSAIAVTDIFKAPIYDSEKAIAEAFNVLYGKITALEDLISKMAFDAAQIDTLTIVKDIKFQGASLFLTGTTAPSVTPDFVGQFYINTTGGTCYQAKGITNASDWKQTA